MKFSLNLSPFVLKLRAKLRAKSFDSDYFSNLRIPEDMGRGSVPASTGTVIDLANSDKDKSESVVSKAPKSTVPSRSRAPSTSVPGSQVSGR